MTDQPNPSQNQDFYGAEYYEPAPDANTPFRAKLMDLFSANDFVRVLNVDDETFTWQYMPAGKEQINFTQTSSVPMTEVVRDRPEVYNIEPGDSKVLLGENAYLMIEGLYKKLAAKKVLRTSSSQPGQARNFNFSDENNQRYWISEIFMGKENPQFGATPKEVVNQPTEEDVKEAVLDEPAGQPVRRGRSKSANLGA